ncbi:MAG: hypothetical protein ACO34C_04395, partial [Candidatus Kapaibacteriota bacterium]
SAWSSPLLIKVVFPANSMSDNINDLNITVNNNFIDIDSQLILPAQFQIFGIDGSCIVTSTIIQLPFYIPIHEIPRGLFFIKVGASIQPLLIH